MPSRIAPFACGVLLAATPLVAQDLLYLDGPWPVHNQVAFDPNRDRLVLLGPQKDLHEWDGQRWLQRPIVTEDFIADAVAFHAASRRTIALGLDNGYAVVTCDWDGAAWRQLSPVTSPPFRVRSAMAYDSLRARVVLFGGRSGQTYLNDTWEWDGANWLQRYPSVSPPPRAYHPLSFDSARGVTVLFGGGDPAGNYDDSWEWDGTDWRQVVLAVRPSARLHHAMAFDATRSRTVLFGGAGLGSGNVFSDLWEYDGTSWTQVPATTPWPTARAGHSLTAVGANELLLTGKDAWSWNGTAWTARTFPTWPLPRQGHVIAIDPVGGGALMFGGWNYYFTVSNDTWRWNGRNWSLVAVSGPPVRSGAAAWTHGTSVYLFGGATSPTLLNDTWRWNGSSWSAVVTATSPPARHSSAVTYDIARAQAVLFGGNNGSWLADTWTFDGSNWHLQSPVTSPPPRYAHALAYDPVRSRAVLFGGDNRNDTWEWDGSNWTQINTTTRPPVMGQAAMAFDVRQNRMVLARQTFGVDLWTYDGMDWAPVAELHQYSVSGPLAVAGWPGSGGVLVSDGAYLFELSSAPATTDTYGNACGLAPSIAGRTRPRLGGADFGVDVIGAPASAPLVLVGATAPASLAIGPCTLLVAPGQASLFALANPAGFVSLDIPVPASPTLFGFALFLQVAALDPTTPAGFVMSAGLRATIGD